MRYNLGVSLQVGDHFPGLLSLTVPDVLTIKQKSIRFACKNFILCIHQTTTQFEYIIEIKRFVFSWIMLIINKDWFDGNHFIKTPDDDCHTERESNERPLLNHYRTAVSRWKFSSRTRSTRNIELIITSLVNTKLCICINLASMATTRAKV